MSDYSAPSVKRPRNGRSELLRESRDDLVDRCLKQQSQIEYLSSKQQSDELVQLKELNEKLRSQLTESQQREGILVMRLTTKEQEVQDLVTQLQEMKQAQSPGSSQLQSLLLDPAVNLMFESIRKELDGSKTKLKQLQDDLAAFKFTPDSHIGKRLMAKCRLLLNENEELGRMISSGSVAKLESTIAMEKKLMQEIKKAEKDAEFYLYELDEDMEGMQATIYHLQQELRESQEQFQQAQDEIKKLRANPPVTEDQVSADDSVQNSLDGLNARRTDGNSEDTERKSTTLNSKAKSSRHSDKTDASAERRTTNKSRSRGTSSNGSREHTVISKTACKRQTDPITTPDSRTAVGTSPVPPPRTDEPKSSSRRGNAEDNSSRSESGFVSETNSASNSTPEKSSRSNERDSKKSRTGGTGKTETTNEISNGIVNKFSSLVEPDHKS